MKPLAPLSVPLTGRHLIEASAGTGKTFTITTLVLRLVVERDMGIERVLVVTFTKAATAELRSRVRTRLRDALDHLDGVVDDPSLRELLARVEPQVARRRVARALSDFDLAAIFTIHGFCQRVLSEHAFESGARFGLDLLTDTSQLLLDATRDEYVRALSAAPPSVAREARRHLRLADLSALVRTATSSPDTL
ncbi:MAG TPA: UvrD-helicase domain-containing protein, partial [Polyangiaceae bacterium]|nr:UvrD-helicase domain-containing protein [Polyangiaceae bacterium]